MQGDSPVRHPPLFTSILLLSRVVRGGFIPPPSLILIDAEYISMPCPSPFLLVAARTMIILRTAVRRRPPMFTFGSLGVRSPLQQERSNKFALGCVNSPLRDHATYHLPCCPPLYFRSFVRSTDGGHFPRDAFLTLSTFPLYFARSPSPSPNVVVTYGHGVP